MFQELATPRFFRVLTRRAPAPNASSPLIAGVPDDDVMALRGEARYRDIVCGDPLTASSRRDGERYDRVADPQHRWGKAILHQLDLDGTEVVLDAGCGTGRVTEELLRRVPNGRGVALDASSSMLDQARRRLRSWGPKVRFVQADLLALDPQVLTDDHPVDAVFLHGNVSLDRRPRQALQQLCFGSDAWSPVGRSVRRGG